MSNFHYEYAVYTDNLNYGRMFLGSSKSRLPAERIGNSAGKGCYIFEKKRIYHETKK